MALERAWAPPETLRKQAVKSQCSRAARVHTCACTCTYLHNIITCCQVRARVKCVRVHVHSGHAHANIYLSRN